jgi:hypothetical protein
MMTHDSPALNNRHLRYLLEILFSVNTGCLAVYAALQFGSPALKGQIYGLNSDIVAALHEHHTDVLTVGHAFLIVATALTICVWVMLRLLAGTGFARATLCYVAGLEALVALPLLKVWQNQNWRYGWAGKFDGMELLDVILITAATAFFFRTPRKIPAWSVILVLAVHYTLWLEVCGILSDIHYHDYRTVGFEIGEQVVLITSLITGVAWILYLRKSSPISSTAGDRISTPA